MLLTFVVGFIQVLVVKKHLIAGTTVKKKCEPTTPNPSVLFG